MMLIKKFEQYCSFRFLRKRGQPTTSRKRLTDLKTCTLNKSYTCFSSTEVFQFIRAGQQQWHALWYSVSLDFFPMISLNDSVLGSIRSIDRYTEPRELCLRTLIYWYAVAAMKLLYLLLILSNLMRPCYECLQLEHAYDLIGTQ